MKKVLFVATVVRLHINMFHKPYIQWFHEQGWQVDVAANNDYEKKDDCVIPYCDHYYCLPFERSPYRKENIDACRQLKELLDREHYDLIHCHTPMGSVITRLAAGKTRRQGTKVLYTAHGFHFYTGAPLLNWLLYYPAERLLAHRTDLLITMNQEDYARAKKMKAKQIAFVHGVGFDLTKFSEDDSEERLEEKQEIRRRLHLKEDAIFAISVAQLIARKNHMVLIEAVAKLQNPHFHLVICGDGEQEKELKAKARTLGVRSQIHFLGFRNDVYRFTRAADLFLFASKQEGLPVAVMEAMACGLPIVASRIRGNMDLIDDEKGGYLVSPDDADGFVNAICRLIANPDKCQEMRAYNLSKIQQYGINAVKSEMTELYRSMME